MLINSAILPLLLPLYGTPLWVNVIVGLLFGSGIIICIFFIWKEKHKRTKQLETKDRNQVHIKISLPEEVKNSWALSQKSYDNPTLMIFKENKLVLEGDPQGQDKLFFASTKIREIQKSDIKNIEASGFLRKGVELIFKDSRKGSLFLKPLRLSSGKYIISYGRGSNADQNLYNYIMCWYNNKPFSDKDLIWLD